jgi:hypothetical protein
MRRTSIMLAAASATLLLFSACTSSSKGAAATTEKGADTTLASSSTAPLDTTPVPTTSLPPIFASGAHKDEPFCVTAVDFNNSSSPLNDSNATAADFQAFFTNVVTPAMAEMRANEPAEVKAEVDTVATAFEQLGAALAANNWDVNKTAADPAVQAAIGQSFSTATQKLSVYCGFGGS